MVLQKLLYGTQKKKNGRAVLANKPKLFIDGTARHLRRHVNTFAVEITALFKGAHQFSPPPGH